jgi:purine-cytosine permease-like protein
LDVCNFSILFIIKNNSIQFRVGIVIIAVISLLVSFCGATTLAWYEQLTWFPMLITFAIALGVGGKNLENPTFEPATARGVLSFASTLAGFTISYVPLGSDYTTYYREDVNRWVNLPELI